VGPHLARTLSGEVRVLARYTFLSKSEWVLLAGLMIVVSSITAVERAGLIPLSDLASSPHAVAEARLWPLITSALLVSYPLVWSLVSFALLGALTLRVCGARVLLISAFAGHIASTLVIYALFGFIRTVDPHAFQAVLKSPDYGVSAVSAAWIGAIAAASWRVPDRTYQGKIATILGVIGAAVFGWIVHGHLNFLDLEHVVAFGIGIVVVVGFSRVGSTRRVELGAAGA
jgi:hypothetical protein